MSNIQIVALFDRLPMLCGFSVSPELEVEQIAVHTWPGWVPEKEVSDEIRATLEDLIVEGPQETADFLRGRTFARTVH